MPETDLIEAIAGAKPVDKPVVLIVAHPDDETIGMGSRLGRINELTLVHVTDGAPANMQRARSLGFVSNEEYSRARFGELENALALLGAKPARQVVLGVRDSEAVFHLAELIDRIGAAMDGAAVVITHPYEGGHPDHDACALATQLACARVWADGGVAPQRLEFACYHSCGGELAANRFWPDPDCPETVVRLGWRERRRKRRAMRAFRTQSFIVESFPPVQEAFRRAPVYDFAKPPPAKDWFYDRYDWPLKGEAWLRHVQAFLKAMKSQPALHKIEASAGG